ncbi:MAG: pilus assembly protein [Myxococcales bacterium]|nr:pilus assembly protein [Myxococcales bacterium]
MWHNASDWLPTLLHSASFWHGPVLYVLLAAACSAVVALLLSRLARRIQARPLHRDLSGTAAAVDFVLTLPILWWFTACVVQFAFLANGTIVVHYAAFSAARTARVHAFAYDNAFVDYPTAIPRLTRLGPLPSVQQEAEQAARFALIAASSADSRFVYPGAPPLPALVSRSLVSAAGDADRSQALMRKAQYAFHPENAEVEVSAPAPRAFGGCDLPPIPGARARATITGPDGCRPVRAMVRFRLPVTVPGAQMIADSCTNGFCYKTAEATVDLL